jgi:hypothetical protein
MIWLSTWAPEVVAGSALMSCKVIKSLLRGDLGESCLKHVDLETGRSIVYSGTSQKRPEDAAACAWRLGIWKPDEERYHYGVVKGCLLDETSASVHKASSTPPPCLQQ